jgi:hypothetical protein
MTEINLMENIKSPSLIDLGSIGSSELGFITVCEEGGRIPFEIKRAYWTYFTPNNVKRGGHAHKNLKQVIVSVSGIIKIKTETLEGKLESFTLDNPDKGLYIENFCWREIKFSHNAVLLCLASEIYRESDYIRDYSEFKKLRTQV